MILCLSWRKSRAIEKQKAECGLLVQCRIEVQSNVKCDIRANLNKRFIDRN